MSGGTVITLAFDGLVAVLLVTTIVYAVILNRRLAQLRQTRSEMEAVIARLAEATDAARNGLAALREHAQEADQGLQRSIDKARGLADELSYLLERAVAAADRLESGISAARHAAPGASAAAPANAAGTDAAGTDAPGRQRPAPRATPRLSPEQAKLQKALLNVR
ncbi:MAG: hypothetical protein D6826_00660 [Alphaproteobacteria bacterium]|nr:MAG: hypothetical protein D6826_00660 [Alphaproteobacteria bacterium]